jgi:hypothetical protein
MQVQTSSNHAIRATKTSTGRIIGNWPDPMQKGGI